MLKAIQSKLMAGFSAKVEARSLVPRDKRLSAWPRDLWFHHESAGKYQVSNLSTTGVAVLDPAANISSKGLLHGELRMGALSLPVSLRVVRHQAGVTGAKFESSTLEVARWIVKNFDVELLGAKLVEIDPSKMQAAPGVTPPRWFYAPGGFEAVLQPDGQLQVAIEEEYFEHVPGKPLRYGKIKGDPLEGGIRHKGSDLVQWSTKVPGEAASRLQRFLSSVDGLRDEAASRFK